MFKFLQFISLICISFSLKAQVLDTLKYYYPYNPENPNIIAFVDECQESGWCEPIAVWFTPDSAVNDSAIKYYSIKNVRFFFAGRIFDDTTFTVHQSDSFPNENNQIYKQRISVDYNDVNENFLNDGIYVFKDFDVSGVDKLRNINIKDPFWVVLQNKVWALHNTTSEGTSIPLIISYHSYQGGLPSGQWENIPAEWVVEVVVQYQTVMDIENPNLESLVSNSATLFQNYPNPFNPSTKISFHLKTPGKVNISIFNMMGQKITTLFDAKGTIGLHSIFFNAEGLSSGIYFYRIVVDGFTYTKKMLYVR